MGNRFLFVKIPTEFTWEELKEHIGKELRLQEFSYQIDHKSLDARKKHNIHWVLRVLVDSPGITGTVSNLTEDLVIPYKKRNKRIVVTGSGPAGFFAAFVLQKAGFDTLILEQGAEVDKRARGISLFEKSGVFDPTSNYAFGEGGAGAFSDGKLTSRSKHISKERNFFLSTYLAAGAPQEIRYLAHPHIGSDLLKGIVKNLRQEYQNLGGEICFETRLTGMEIKDEHIVGAVTGQETLPADYFIVAPGHSSYETYRMLMNHGVLFRTKNFALGFRAEHRQQEINLSQWGVEEIPGVKAAEYRLTSNGTTGHPVYSFCMCPGGVVVQATPYPGLNIVNGMSRYRRDGNYANAGCVAGVHPNQLANRRLTPVEALDWLEQLEQSFYLFSGGYQAPFCGIREFLTGREPSAIPQTSYSPGLKPARLWEMLPVPVIEALRVGLRDFNRKIKGYDQGILLGLESKTSSPVQVLRGKNGLCSGFQNLYLAGEGSGYAGGIVSSAADGIKIAFHLLE